LFGGVEFLEGECSGSKMNFGEIVFVHSPKVRFSQGVVADFVKIEFVIPLFSF